MPEQWSSDQLYVHFTEIFRQQELLASARDEKNKERVEAIEKILTGHVEAAAKELQTAFSAAQRAIEKAEQAQDKRNDEASDFRQELSDRTSEFPTREVIDARFSEFDKRLLAGTEELSKRLYEEREAKGRENQAMLLALANRVTNEAFDQYVDRQEDLRAGNRRASNQALISIVLAVFTTVGGIVLVIVTHGHG